MPKISVIIPIYNVEKYLSRCLDSILSQTFTDFEVILVDDCSPDNSIVICNEYAKKDGRIKVFKTKKNGGASVARNVGLKESNGEYVSFVDSDDHVEPNYLERLLKEIERTNADIVQCGYYEVVNNIKSEDVISVEPFSFTGERAFGLMYGDGDANVINFLLWNKLYKKEAIGDLLFLEGIPCEDAIFISQLVLKVKRIVAFSDQLYYYCRHDDSLMGKMESDKKDLIKSHVLAYRKVVESVKNESIYVQTLASARLASFYVSAIKNKMLKRDKELKKMLKEDKKRFKFRKNKNIPLIKRVVLSLWG